MITICVACQKGGVGKTATACAVGEAIRRFYGKSVLFVDCDPQGDLSVQLQADTQRGTITDVFRHKRRIEDTIQRTPKGHILPSDGFLAADNLSIGRNGERTLKALLSPVKEKFDFCIIDTPPTLASLTLNALTAADYVLIPTKADRFSVLALREIFGTIQAVQSRLNPGLHVLGVIITMFQGRATICKIGAEEIQEQAAALGVPVIEPPIRAAVAVSEAQLGGSIYDTKNNASDDYRAVTAEIMKILEL